MPTNGLVKLIVHFIDIAVMLDHNKSLMTIQ